MTRRGQALHHGHGVYLASVCGWWCPRGDLQHGASPVYLPSCPAFISLHSARPSVQFCICVMFVFPLGFPFFNIYLYSHPIFLSVYIPFWTLFPCFAFVSSMFPSPAFSIDLHGFPKSLPPASLRLCITASSSLTFRPF